MEPKEQRKVDDFIIYAMGAATQALTDAGWKPTAYEDQIRTGVLIGSGIGGLQGIEKTSLLFERGTSDPEDEDQNTLSKEDYDQKQDVFRNSWVVIFVMTF